jgi:hypothetical protein
MRAKVTDDGDLLYYIAGLYSRIGQKETTEQILQDIVRIDPEHAQPPMISVTAGPSRAKISVRRSRSFARR